MIAIRPPIVLIVIRLIAPPDHRFPFLFWFIRASTYSASGAHISFVSCLNTVDLSPLSTFHVRYYQITKQHQPCGDFMENISEGIAVASGDRNVVSGEGSVERRMVAIWCYPYLLLLNNASRYVLIEPSFRARSETTCLLIWGSGFECKVSGEEDLSAASLLGHHSGIERGSIVETYRSQPKERVNEQG